MKILGAGVYFPRLEINSYVFLHNKPYFCEKPKASDEDLMVEMALPVCQKVLAEAHTTASEIDMILSISVSPDHLFRSPEMAAPRLCHPLQRELKADNAFVFDLIDADWTMAIEIASGFAESQGYQKILIVRTEVTAPSVEPDETTGFDFVDGVGVLLVSPSEKPHLTSFHTLTGVQHAQIRMLPPEQMASGQKKAEFKFPYDARTLEILNKELIHILDFYMATGTSEVEVVAESWIPQHGDHVGSWKHFYKQLGAFTLPAYAEERLKQHRSMGVTSIHTAVDFLSITLNPFVMRYGAQLLTLEPVLAEENTIQESIFS